MYKKLKDIFKKTFKTLVMYSYVKPVRILGVEDEYKITIGQKQSFIV